MVSKSRFSLIFLYTGSSELVNRTETSKLKDAPRVLPAGQYGERLFLCAWRRGVHDLWGRWPPGVHDLWGRWPPGGS